MKLHNHFREKDLLEASKQYHCFKDLLALIDREAKRGDMQSAILRTEDMLKSLEKMAELSAEKYNEDRYQSLMKQREQKGIDAKILLLHFGGQL